MLVTHIYVYVYDFSYSFTPRASDDGLVVLCSARNEQIARSTAKTLSLNVLRKFYFTSISVSHSVEVSYLHV